MIYSELFKIRTIEASGRKTARPSVVIDLMQDVAGGHLAALDIDDEEMHEVDRQAFIISRMALELYERMPATSKVDTRTWYTIGKAANFPRNYETRVDGEVTARGFSTWALVDIDSKKLIKYKDYGLPDELAEERLTLGIPDRFRIPKDAIFEEAGEMTVELWQTDINKHLNNARYIDPMWSNLPEIEKRDVKALSINYVHEALKGDTLKIMVSQPYEFDLVVNEGEDVISNHYSRENDTIYYVRMETEEEVKAQAMWIVTKCD